MTKKQLEKLFIFLEGYCQFEPKGKDDFTWLCSHTLKATRWYLKEALNFDKVKIEKAVKFLNNKGGYCDCEVLFNVQEHK